MRMRGMLPMAQLGFAQLHMPFASVLLPRPSHVLGGRRGGHVPLNLYRLSPAPLGRSNRPV